MFITVVTVVIGAFGYRISRNTSDFLVASRTVSPRLNASAIAGEYLSAASFLGVAGLIMVNGVDMLWYPVGFTAGYLAMLLYVAAPLRRSGAYTLPDFAEATAALDRRCARWPPGSWSLIGWLYLVPQLQGAGLTLTTVTGAPSWVGAVVVGAVVTLNVAVGGMRSITFVQAFQYWVKLTAIAFPAMVLLAVWFHRDGAPGAGAASRCSTTASRWLVPLTGLGAHPLFTDYSLILATFLGTMGLPHVLVRFYTNPDGAGRPDAPRWWCSACSGIFYLFPTVYGALGRVYAPQLLLTGNADAVVLVLPDAALGGLPGAAARRRWSPPARSPRSCPPPAGCWSRCPGCCPPTCSAAGPAGTARSATSAAPPWWPASCRCCWPCRPARSDCPLWSVWRSRWPRRRSARCWCWGSGGGG